MTTRKLLATAIMCALSCFAAAQSDPISQAWNQPVSPFRVIGNIYYVGASDVTSFLVTTPQGHILLDGGLAETAPIIRKNIEQLGFKISDVHILLNSHAHFDHAGGLAALKQLSGARMMASEGDRPLLEHGGHNDPQFGDSLLFPPVRVNQVIRDGETIELGGVAMRAVLTPGHTPGCTTWALKVTEGSKKYDAVFLCSTSAPGNYQLVNNKAYPKIASDYEQTFIRLKALHCDVFLGAHGSFFHLTDKIKRLKALNDPNPFIDPDGYREFLTESEQAFRQKLQEQTRAASPSR